MLFQAPAAFGLVTFLMHEGVDRNRIRKHLLVFSVAAPALALLTYFGIGQVSTVIFLHFFFLIGIIIDPLKTLTWMNVIRFSNFLRFYRDQLETGMNVFWIGLELKIGLFKDYYHGLKS